MSCEIEVHLISHRKCTSGESTTFNRKIIQDFHLSMGCYWCFVISGDLVLKEHEAARWLGKNELMDVEWLPADVKLINRISKDVSLM